jgi:septal ring factor EnvC (AmiA/AmiB activator)
MDNPKNRKTIKKIDEKVAFKKKISRYFSRKYALPTGGAILILALSVFSWAMYQDTKEKTSRLNDVSGQVTQLATETKHMQEQQAILNADLTKQKSELEKQKADNAEKQKQIEELKQQNASLGSQNEELVKKYKELVTP